MRYYPPPPPLNSPITRHPQIYQECYKKETSNGVTIDKCIQPSIDFTGKILGLVAGDEECYEVTSSLVMLRHLPSLPVLDQCVWSSVVALTTHV